MKYRILYFLVIFSLGIGIIIGISSCGLFNSSCEHDYVVTERIEATCTKDGTITYECSKCGDTYTEAIEKTGHSYVETVRVDATCTEDGTITYECSKCGDTYTEDIEKTGHSYVETARVDATCTDEGSILYECIHCGEEHSEVISVTGHTYTLKRVKEPTCETAGYNIFVCDICGEVFDETVEALGHDWVVTEEAAPTYSQDGYYVSKCSRCDEEKTDVIDKLEYELAINYYNGFFNQYITTDVFSQDTTGYYLGNETYYNSSTTITPMEFEYTMALQNFYTHSILSIKQPTTADGKIYTVDSGFEVLFNFNFIDKTIPETYTEFLSLFDSDALLKVVDKKKTSNSYFYVYEVVDFSCSYIQIAKLVDGKYVTVDEIKTIEQWQAFLSGDCILSDSNNKAFFDAGTYRIMIKTNVSWFVESTTNGKIFDSSGAECFPYGYVNDQYDYFYVTVSGESFNILQPYDMDETHDMFYQLRFMDSVTQQAFIKSGESVSVGDQFKLVIDTKLVEWTSNYHYNDYQLKEWVLSISLYDSDTDSYSTCYYTYDLLDLIADDGTVSITLPNDYRVQGNCKIMVSYTLYDSGSSDEVTQTDNYYMYIS